MKPTVYIDSTVPSYWLEQGPDPIVQARHLVTRRWWAEEVPRFEPFISQVVLDELGGGQPERAARRVKLVEGFGLLDVDEEVEEAAMFYVENLANASKRTPIEALNRRLHLASPVICSPEELMLEPLE